MSKLVAPFPYFGGKRSVADEVWRRFGSVKQYIEPFCGSAAILLAAPSPASLEVICDANMYVANFWRATKHQPEAVAEWADYPVSHIDQYGRHRWLKDPDRTAELKTSLSDPEWPGDAKVAGWWVWGQCSSIGSSCFASSGNKGIPFLSSDGQGLLRACGGSLREFAPRDGLRTPAIWIGMLSARLDRVRAIHGDWTRCLNHHFGGASTAVFLDPPYRKYESVYGCDGVADAVEEWARDHADLRVALCGHEGDYDLPDWDCWAWSRPNTTLGSKKTTDLERIWFSPACNGPQQAGLFDGIGGNS